MPQKRRRQSGSTSTPKRSRKTTSKSSLPTNLQAETQNDKDPVTPPQAATSSFLSLPRELRDQIYKEVWLSKPEFEVALPELGNHHHAGLEHGPREYYHVFRVSSQFVPTPRLSSKLLRHNDIDFTDLNLGRSKPQPRGSWIQASRQILREAMEQFNQQATWTYAACYWGQKGRQVAAWRLPHTKSRSAKLKTPILLALSNAVAIHVPGQLCTRLYAAMDDGSAPFLNVELRMDALKLLDPLTSGISGTMKLQRLSLNIHAATWWRGFEEGHVEFKFKPLDSLYLPNLQLLRLSVSHSDKFFASKLLMDGLREAVTVLGKGLLGGSAKEVFEPSVVHSNGVVISEWVVWYSRL